MKFHTRIKDLRAKRAELEQGGWPRRQAMQRKDAKQTARERIDALVDADSFEESGLFAQHRQTLFGMADKEVPADGVLARPAVAEGLSEELIFVIGAAIAAFVGKRAHIRQIHLIGSFPWAQQGRVMIQASHALSVHSARSQL